MSAAGELEIDQVIGIAKDSVIGKQVVVEGYSNQPSAADQMAASRSRSLIVAHYLEKRFHLSTKNIELMPLKATAPPSSRKDSWDGACIVLLQSTTAMPAYITSLIHHFEDLRDGTHGGYPSAFIVETVRRIFNLRT